VRLVDYAPRERQPLHAHARTTLTLVLRGSLEERVGERIHRATVMSLVVKPAGTLHEDSFGPEGTRTLQIVLSESDEAAVRERGPALDSWRWVQAGEAARAMLAMLRALGPGAGDGRASVETLLDEVLVSLEPAPPPAGRPAPRWLRTVRDALAVETRPIRALATEAGVHPVHLAHAFRRHYGTTPSEHRRRARLGRAAALLSETRLPLTEVAFEAGFADQAHLTRALRGATGETPRTFRRLAAGA
jgi:AraC family transcriptional regulator